MPHALDASDVLEDWRSPANARGSSSRSATSMAFLQVHSSLMHRYRGLHHLLSADLSDRAPALEGPCVDRSRLVRNLGQIAEMQNDLARWREYCPPLALSTRLADVLEDLQTFLPLQDDESASCVIRPASPSAQLATPSKVRFLTALGPMVECLLHLDGLQCLEVIPSKTSVVHRLSVVLTAAARIDVSCWFSPDPAHLREFGPLYLGLLLLESMGARVRYRSTPTGAALEISAPIA